MRAGLAFSAVGHLALLLWGFVLFASPRPFAPIPPESIMVDIVPAAAMAHDLQEQPGAESAAAQQQPEPDHQQQPAANPQIGTASASQLLPRQD
jgi:predicted lipid-binding transport protein (Tim44 family)